MRSLPQAIQARLLWGHACFGVSSCNRANASLQDLTPLTVEASSSAHHWARKLVSLGLDARIIPAHLVAPYRLQGKGGKNDANDAAAICESASRPQMHFMPIKTVDQQSMLCIHRLREG